MRTLGVVACLVIALFGPAATGLQGQTGPGKVADVICWRGKALPACGSFMVFEMEGGWAVASTTFVGNNGFRAAQFQAFENELKWHLGAMRNLTEEWALGATVSVGDGSPSLLTGIRLRARRWLKPSMSAELEAGAVHTGNTAFATHWGPTVGARLNMGDLFSIFTRWEGATAFNSAAGFQQGLYVGASAGSTLAVVGSGISGALGLLALLTPPRYPK